MQKRIIHEITHVVPELRERYNIRFNIIAIANSNIINNDIECVEIYDTLDNMTIFYMYFNNGYPFRPPKLKLNRSISTHYTEENYDRWAINIIRNANNHKLELAYIFTIIRQPLAKKYIKHIPTHKTCFCCDTILCSSNWSPSNTIFDIMMEYICRDILRSFLTPLRFRQMTQIFDNDRWSLNNDLLFSIIQQL